MDTPLDLPDSSHQSVPALDQARSLLVAAGIGLDDRQVGLLERHVQLIREWNSIVGVVSTAEVDHLWERHIVDSLSLGPIIRQLGFSSGHLVDIGSGGGFPAIPLRIVLPELHMTLVERSEKKIGFLRKVTGALGLSAITIIQGEFGSARLTREADIITVRAVETPGRLLKHIMAAMTPATVFLSQSGLKLVDNLLINKVEDDWSRLGLRRGTLDIVRLGG